MSATDTDTDAAIALGASVLARIEDRSAREVAIRNALTASTRFCSVCGYAMHMPLKHAPIFKASS